MFDNDPIYRELFERSPAGCPNRHPDCDHLATTHMCEGYDELGAMVRPWCPKPDCKCTWRDHE